MPPGRFSKLYAGNIMPALAHFMLQGTHVSDLLPNRSVKLQCMLCKEMACVFDSHA